MDPTAPVLGFIVNPIAGMGGAVALHGTDGAFADRAIRLGATPVAAKRAARALRTVIGTAHQIVVLAAPNVMGEDVARAVGLDPLLTRSPVAEPTSAQDTRAAAEEMAHRGVDLILFVGGDGTARDVAAAVGTGVPVLGVPSGVKMHSGVFGTTPETAGQVAASFLLHPAEATLTNVDVLDAEEAAAERDEISTERFGVARVPFVQFMLQRTKAAGRATDEASLTALCEEIAREMKPERTYVVGPGTTTARILAALGLAGSVTGVDVVRDRALVAKDASEAELLELLSGGGRATLILGVIGGQGFLLGRGNQQISADVLSLVDVDNMVIVAGADKIEQLDPPVLHVDLAEPEASAGLAGWHRVRTGPKAITMLKVVG